MYITILFLAILLISLLLTLLEVLWWRPVRLRRYGAEQQAEHRSKIAAYIAGFFWPVLIILLLRSFVMEPFRIPSGSMLPTLQAGDMIAVNKFSYGLRLPLLHYKIASLGQPERGDIAVFRYPLDPSIDYVKRVVALPGDTVEYVNRRLWVNGQPVALQDGSLERKEKLGDTVFRTQLSATPTPLMPLVRFPYAEQCVYYNPQHMRCVVPAGHYFLMGDNRDNSQDSRYWGFVPDRYLVGKVVYIWFNMNDFSRIGKVQ